MTPTVHPIAIPNPFFEGRNQAYVIVADPITLIDTGVATSRAFVALEDGLKQHGLQIHDVRRVVLTHKHIDHVGNAWRIQQASGADVWIHNSECEAVVNVDPTGEGFVHSVIDRLREWHAPDHIQTATFSHAMPHWEIEPADVRGLVDGQQLTFESGHLEVLHTPGHTVGSICLRLASQLFTGDHVLPGISPNVGGGDLRHRGLLGQFFGSLERIKRISDNLVAMPGHGEPFSTLGPRCDELIAHHHERLDAIRQTLRRGPLTVYELAVDLFGQMDDFHVILGCAEAHAHLEWLVERAQVMPLEDGARFALC
jgi:glyoxylase-like metal-dependent hydrolase (beta-lactamase superfamily II)